LEEVQGVTVILIRWEMIGYSFQRLMHLISSFVHELDMMFLDVPRCSILWPLSVHAHFRLVWTMANAV